MTDNPDLDVYAPDIMTVRSQELREIAAQLERTSSKTAREILMRSAACLLTSISLVLYAQPEQEGDNVIRPNFRGPRPQ